MKAAERAIFIGAIARITHEANRAYCVTLGDRSQVAWSIAPDWQCRSAIHGVDNIVTGRVSCPEESHGSWLGEKKAAGWVYGETKNPEAKTHPCMVPYENLPDEQKAKDALFFAIVKALRDA